MEAGIYNWSVVQGAGILYSPRAINVLFGAVLVQTVEPVTYRALVWPNGSGCCSENSKECGLTRHSLTRWA
jgi:hypothetical protein